MHYTLPFLNMTFVFLYAGLLIRLSWIDWKHQLLPDNLTYPLLWSGLLYQVFFSPPALPSAVIGAVAGYLSLWVLFWLYMFMRKQEGIGYGDMKLLAALGAWHGWQNLYLILLLAAGSGLLFLGVKKMLLLDKTEIATPLPFGPFLAIAGGVTGWLSSSVSPIIELNSVL